MRRLDGASALMIYFERPSLYQHTLKIAMLEFGEEFDSVSEEERFNEIKEHFKQQSIEVPYLRWKLARVPFGLNHPYWVYDDEFDLDYHVRRVSCPAPGDRKTFCKLVSELYAQTLNDDVPLWTVWLVEGLADGKVAMVVMLHHAYTDGVGASLILRRLIKPVEEREHFDDLGVPRREKPSKIKLLARGAFELPLMFFREVPAITRDFLKLRRIKKQRKRDGLENPPSLRVESPSELLSAPFSRGRTFFYDSFDLAEFKATGKHYNASINDLLLAVMSGALRSFHEEQGAATQSAVIATIPVNVRTEKEKNAIIGNYVAAEAVSIPIHIDDPLKRIERVKESAQTMKSYVKATQGSGMFRAAELLPPIFVRFVTWMIKSSKGKIAPLGSMAISNVPGPKEYLKINDKVRIGDWLSIGQVALGVGLNITAWSYVDRLNICLMANTSVIPDGEQFFKHVHAAYEEYIALAAEEQIDPETQHRQRS